MKILAEISEQSLGFSDESPLGKSYILRKSARAVLCNELGEIALQYIGLHDYYKLPGGGVQIGETEEEALRREIQEEVGCAIEIIRPLGLVIEYRYAKKLLHISYGYVAKVVGSITQTAFDEDEMTVQQRTVWVDPEQVSRLIQATPVVPVVPVVPGFISAREQEFFAEYIATKG